MRPISIGCVVMLVATCLPAIATGSLPSPVPGAVASAPSTAPAAAAASARDSTRTTGAPASVTATSAPVAQRKGPQDPMEFLRERLAAKLGGGATLDASKPGIVRVVNRSPASDPAPARVTASAAPKGTGSPSSTSAPARRSASTPPRTWGYAGTAGPDHWGALDAGFATCAQGQRQSPIDIRDGIAVDLDPIAFDYHASPFRVTDTGHTVQVDVDPGDAIEVLGRRYELQQLHFHNPSEERIAGRQFAMVAHLVHKSADGRIAIVAVLLEPGSANAVVQSVWNNLPLERGEPVVARKSLDLAALLPAERGYFTYMGSLTTPPCSEGVLWMVMREPVQLSAAQIAIFARLYPMNARPLQQAAGRLIKQSN